MAKLKVAEIFYTLQGEGKFVGVPSVFLRTFGCNFQCRGFGFADPKMRATEPEEIAEQLAKHPEWRYEDLPLAEHGCDSYASWHPKFKSLSPTMDVEQVMQEIEMTRQAKHNAHSNKNGVHLVITGGEPLLGWQRAYPELLELAAKAGYKEITFETNGTQAITNDFADFLLRNQITNDHNLNFTFSVSPKLTCSGEERRDALQPEIVASYQQFGDVYLKYVVSNGFDLDDVHLFNQQYKNAGLIADTYLMPVGGVVDQYTYNAGRVADLAMTMGYKYSPRLQVDIWKNAWGT